MDFRWNEWNMEHIACHGIDPGEAEAVVRTAHAPYPEKTGDDKWLVRGPGRGGRWLQVVFIDDSDASVFVIHARPLSEREKRRERKKRR